MISTTRPTESTAPTGGLLLAVECPRIRQIPAGAVGALATEIERAKTRLGCRLTRLL